ncbi:hypothetical protein BLX06_23415 [Bacillus cereus]|uniref:Uncharacterized protein n=1 Tax=Bacillus cereus TaxID=1396 RepID=A0A9X6B7S7_BACCE|nr:hypothetical protein BLX06_23415 [Bacillus cereus]
MQQNDVPIHLKFESSNTSDVYGTLIRIVTWYIFHVYFLLKTLLYLYYQSKTATKKVAEEAL